MNTLKYGEKDERTHLWTGNSCSSTFIRTSVNVFSFLQIIMLQQTRPAGLKGTVQWQLRRVKIGINRSNMTNCLAGKCSLPCPNAHHHERSINFSASLVHFNTIPTGRASKHYSVGLILLQRPNSDAVAAQRRSIPKCAVKTSAVIITASVCPKMYIFLATW